MRKNGGREVSRVHTRPAYPRLFRPPSMDSFTQPTSLVRGVTVENGRKRTHRGRRSSEARIRRSWLRSSNQPIHHEKRRRRHADTPGSGAGDPVASWEEDQSFGRGRSQAKRRKLTVAGAIAQRHVSKLATFNARTLTSRWRRMLAQDRDQWSQLCSHL